MAPKDEAPEQGTTPGQASNPNPAVVNEDQSPSDILRNAQNLLAGGNITAARDQIAAAISAIDAPKSARKGARKGKARKSAAKKTARKGAKRR